MNDKNNKLLDGILTICYYNSYEEFIIDLIEFLDKKDLHEQESIIYFEDFLNGKYKWEYENPTYENSSLHIIQMLLINEYGEYGTSPRFGWITKENYNRLLEDLKNEIQTNWQTNDESPFQRKGRTNK